MSGLARILDSINIRYLKSGLRSVEKPFHLQHIYEPKNYIVQIHKGNLSVGQNFMPLNPGNFYFVPSGQAIYAKFGKTDQYKIYLNQSFSSQDEKDKYLKQISVKEDFSNYDTVFSLLAFDVTLYDVTSLFSILEIPSFLIPPIEPFNFLLKSIIEEEEASLTGKNKILSGLTEQFVVHLCRYMESQPEYSGYFDNIDYLLDKRLIAIIQYIHQNLDKDLSNKTISDIACVSEDYVGQFFKSLANKNLQEYIEDQRLHKALHLLRSSGESIQAIAHQVGFKDPAYFSRRFKLNYNENANSIRKKENFLI